MMPIHLVCETQPPIRTASRPPLAVEWQVVNIEKRLLRGQTRFRHYSDSLPPFDEHTDDTILESVDFLASQFPLVSEARFRELTQETGRNYSPSGICYDASLRREGQLGN
jgi:hypothetical protein